MPRDNTPPRRPARRMPLGLAGAGFVVAGVGQTALPSPTLHDLTGQPGWVFGAAFLAVGVGFLVAWAVAAAGRPGG